MSTSITRRYLVRAGVVTTLAAAAPSLALAADAPAENRVCKTLGIEKPVVQAFMNELTSPELAAAVSNAGGLGILGMPDEDALDATLALTDKPFAVAHYTKMMDDDYLAMLKDKGVTTLLIPVAENDAEPIAHLKDEGFTVIGKVLGNLDYMTDLKDAGIDVLAPIGYGAGGCGPNHKIPFIDLLAEYRDKITVPMLAAGGIVNARTARSAVAMGAEGAYCGSAFLLAQESPCSDGAKQVIINTRAEDMVEIPVGFGLIRATKTQRSQDAVAMIGTASESDIYASVVGWAPAMRDGTYDDFFVNCGAAANLLNEVRPAADIVDDIASAFQA